MELAKVAEGDDVFTQKSRSKQIILFVGNTEYDDPSKQKELQYLVRY